MHRVVPEPIVENYRAGRFSGEFPAVGMFLDLSGFSTMTDTLMQHGQHGAEVLASLMHGVFNPLVESIFEHGGKIVSFAGDGIMALYPVDADEKMTALRALASAWVVQQRLMENPDRRTMYGKFTFSAKIGLSLGSVSWQILRSNEGDNATYYFRGSAVDDSSSAEHQANAGEIILTQKLNDLLGEDVRTRPKESFHRFIRFRVEIPTKSENEFPPVDIDVSRVFMPEEVIVDGVRGEFRQIANLFISIPDLPDAELKNFVKVIFELKKKYGGLVTRLDFGDKGCNMLLLWGAPVAYENDIGRALNFILDLRSKMNFPITAGVTYYIAHAGYLGSELCEDYTCYGWGVNLAARFMMTAPTGEIWVDERIAGRVSQRFAMDYVGSQRFKGFAAEQKVHVLRYRKVESEVIYQGEMVGREDELSRIKDFVEPLWQGKFAGVITVSGEAGIGKGRLIHEFSTSELFNLQETHWANCKANQILRQAFNPLRGWLLRYFGIGQDQSVAERKAAFDSKLDDLRASTSDPELAHELERTRSFLGALIDLRWDESLFEKLDAEARYNNIILGLIALLKAESLRQPVILFLDDVQFIDEDTSVFLRQFKRSIEAAEATGEPHPIAIILTLRKQGVSLPLIEGLSDAEIELIGIPKNAIVKLTENILGGTVSSELMELIISRSEGNPYFAEQVIRYLVEEHQLETSDKGWIRVERARDAVLPSDIRALLVARLDKLPREVKSAVHTASVLGREFDFGVLAQMLGSELTTKDQVDEAEKAVIWSRLNDIRYMFYHGLLRDAAYTMQMRARRQELHILALNALEIMYEDEPDRRYAELAYHAEQGEVRSKAQRYYTLAGKFSASQYQNSQAVDYFTKALAFTAFDDLDTQFDLLAERVELYSRMGKRDLQLNDLETLEQKAEQLKSTEYLVKVKMLRTVYYYMIGDYIKAIEYAERVHESSTEGLPFKMTIDTQTTWAISLLRTGRTDEAMQQALRGFEMARVSNRRVEEGGVLSSMGLIALEQKNPAVAYDYLAESLSIARDMDDPRLEFSALSNLAISEASVKGNYAISSDYYNKAHQIAKKMGDRYREGIALANMGFSAGMLGDFETASIHHEKSLTVAREIGSVNQELYTLINLSAVAGFKNDSSDALKFAKLAEDLSRKIHDRSAEAWSMLYMGHAYLLTKEYGKAVEVYKKSISIRNELGQPTLATEPMAGLIEASIYVNDGDSASRETEKILTYLNGGNSLDGAEEPLRVYYACYLFLSQQKDPRAQQVLQIASQLLEAQVMKISDDLDRRRFVENIPWRRAIRDASLIQ